MLDRRVFSILIPPRPVPEVVGGTPPEAGFMHLYLVILSRWESCPKTKYERKLQSVPLTKQYRCEDAHPAVFNFPANCKRELEIRFVMYIMSD